MFPSALLFNLTAGTASATIATWEVVRSSDAPGSLDRAFTALNVSFTGGSTDTVVVFSVETSADGTVWHNIANLGLTASAKSSVGQVGEVRLGRYVRVVVVVSGTAPTIRTGTGLLLTTFPCTLTAI